MFKLAYVGHTGTDTRPYRINPPFTVLGETEIARPPMNQRPERDGPRMNRAIRVPEVRLIDQEGAQLGIVDTRDAIAKSEAVGMDLVEISPTAKPPVCKIMDYGRFKYLEQKKKNEARKKQKIVEVKEIKMRPNIDDHDYDVKMRNVNKFLGNGDKVKFTIRFRGRELAHQNRGMMVLDRVRDDLGETIRMEHFPKMEGRQMIMVVAPK